MGVDDVPTPEPKGEQPSQQHDAAAGLPDSFFGPTLALLPHTHTHTHTQPSINHSDLRIFELLNAEKPLATLKQLKESLLEVLQAFDEDPSGSIEEARRLYMTRPRRCKCGGSPI